MKSPKILTGVLVGSIAILGVSVYSYSLFGSHAQTPSAIETKHSVLATPKTSVKPKNDSKAKDKKYETISTDTKQESAKPLTTTDSKAVALDEFNGFIRVPHKILKGENAWNIQEALTPNENINHMLELVSEANGNSQLNLIYPGEMVSFLKEKDNAVAQSTTVQATTAVTPTVAVEKPTNTDTPSQPTTNNTVRTGVSITNNTSTQDIINLAKSMNNPSQKTVTVQLSSGAVVTFNNVTKTGEVKRDYTYSASQVQYTTPVDYDIVNTSVQGSKGIFQVISPDADSQAMYDISKELSTLIRNSNSTISSVDVYFYNNQDAVNAGNYKWKYSDGTPSSVTQRSTFTF